ncbi:class I SAM-dependent rRNA methyltransferase [Ignavigranum ruoffiae]|uniref:class I SAM-dependent rRNA methyltransferase n=1 Tax=Ignavigranum ruoffiae TaxID=89093 RepID=UPI0024AE0DF6|nr:class I SAM-dependent rRNA methyltransferase [Ignavigranum ruoffiae]
MTTYKMKSEASQKIHQGYKLITEEDFLSGQGIENEEEGQRIILTQANGEFLAQAIVGRQHKGFAWIYSTRADQYFTREFFEHCLAQALDQRFASFDLQKTNAFRLFNGEGDGVGGFTLDYYDGYLQINWYSRGIYAYRQWLNHYLQASPYDFKGCYQTLRFDLTGDEEAIQHLWGDQAPQPLKILENGVSFAIYLGQDWMTGLFTDQREVRLFISQQAQGESLLNLFAYTGAFSVVAALAGIEKTVSVDVANRSRQGITDNFSLNGINLAESDHEIRIMDVFDYLRYAKRHQLQFDWVVCDPPTYARTKKYVFSADRDYPSLAEDLFTLTKPGGMTVISTNHSGYDSDHFRQEMIEVANQHPGKCQLIQSFDLPEDYPTSEDAQSQYLKVLVFYRTC